MYFVLHEYNWFTKRHLQPALPGYRTSTLKTKILREVRLESIVRNNRNEIQSRGFYPSGEMKLEKKRKRKRTKERDSGRQRGRGRGRREHAAGWLVYSSAYNPLVDGAARNAQLLRNQCASPPCLMLRIRSPSEAARPRPF